MSDNPAFAESLALSAVLCSRLCHDLVNPVGAVINGVEILADEDDPDMQAEVVDLLEQSARQVADRLQFFRLAFGAATAMGDAMAMSQVRNAAEALFASGKSALDWRVEVPEVGRDGARLLLNLILVAHESLIRGGGVTVAGVRRNGGVVFNVTAQGDRILMQDGVRQALAGQGDVANLEPKAAPAFLAACVAGNAGGGIGIEDGDGYLTLTATMP